MFDLIVINIYLWSYRISVVILTIFCYIYLRKYKSSSSYFIFIGLLFIIFAILIEFIPAQFLVNNLISYNVYSKFSISFYILSTLGYYILVYGFFRLLFRDKRKTLTI